MNSLQQVINKELKHYFFLKAESADEKLAKTMFLPLAERMTQKYVTDGKIEAEAGM